MKTKPAQRTHQQAPEKIRTFIAIDLPESMRTAIRTIQTDIRSSGFKIRWTNPENVHLTLKFLGDVDTHLIAKINAAMKMAVKEIASIHLSGRRLGVFPNARRPRILWIGLDGQIGALLRLQKKIDAQCASLGFAREKRTFTGHLTI
jgi:2'-5' RNA ligase